MSKTSSKPAPKTTAPAAKVIPVPTTSITAEQAMLVIGEYARERGAGWREALRAFWNGEGDESALFAARTVVPPAILDNLDFKAKRPAKPLTPEQDAARRLRRVGTAMRSQAKALQRRAKETNALARQLRLKNQPAEVAAAMRSVVESGRLKTLEGEFGL